MSSIAYLHGQFMPLADARVSVLDRGFLFGDGVYEVIPVYDGKIFLPQEHLRRLRNSLRETGIPLPLSFEDLAARMQELVAHNGGADKSLYLQVTRGYQPQRDHAFPEEVQSTLFMMLSELVPVTDPAAIVPAKVITLPDNRWTRCNIKSICLLPNVLLRQQALDSGVNDAILLRDSFVTEASAANVFIVLDGEVRTPPSSNLLLGGITRDLILELLRRERLPVSEQAIALADLRRAEEVWLSSSTREIVPVIELDGAPVGDGKPGVVWRDTVQRFQVYKQQVAAKV